MVGGYISESRVVNQLAVELKKVCRKYKYTCDYYQERASGTSNIYFVVNVKYTDENLFHLLELRGDIDILENDILNVCQYYSPMTASDIKILFNNKKR